MIHIASKWKTDPGLGIVKTKLSHPLQQDHDIAISQLVNAIAIKISSTINYDHAETTYPHTDIDLVHERHRYDIAYRTTAGNEILIEVKVRRRKNSPKSLK